MELAMDSIEFLEEEWECLKLVQQLSQPITEATEYLSGDKYPTASLVIPIIMAARYTYTFLF